MISYGEEECRVGSPPGLGKGERDAFYS